MIILYQLPQSKSNTSISNKLVAEGIRRPVYMHSTGLCGMNESKMIQGIPGDFI